MNIPHLKCYGENISIILITLPEKICKKYCHYNNEQFGAHQGALCSLREFIRRRFQYAG
jgi:hypothetical protein